MQIIIHSEEFQADLPMKMFGEKIGEKAKLYQLALIIEETLSGYFILNELKSEIKIYLDNNNLGGYMFSMRISDCYQTEIIEPYHFQNEEVIKTRIRSAINNLLTTQKENR